MYMAISKESYLDLKAYWDYQRLREYNKELLKFRLNKVKDHVFTQMGPIDPNTMFEDIWVNIKEEDLEQPKPGRVPQDEKLRFEWQGEPDNTIKVPKYKGGRPVILRARPEDVWSDPDNSNDDG